MFESVIWTQSCRIYLVQRVSNFNILLQLNLKKIIYQKFKKKK